MIINYIAARTLTSFQRLLMVFFFGGCVCINGVEFYCDSVSSNDLSCSSVFLDPLKKYRSLSCSEKVFLRFYFCNDMSGFFPLLSAWLLISFD